RILNACPQLPKNVPDRRLQREFALEKQFEALTRFSPPRASLFEAIAQGSHSALQLGDFLVDFELIRRLNERNPFRFRQGGVKAADIPKHYFQSFFASPRYRRQKNDWSGFKTLPASVLK